MLIPVITVPAAAQQYDASQQMGLSVNCRDKAELTQQFCFPYRVTGLDVQLFPTMTGYGRVAEKQVDSNGCVTVTLEALGERRLTDESPGSFATRQSKAPDPLQIPQCIGTNVSAQIRVKY